MTDLNHTPSTDDANRHCSASSGSLPDEMDINVNNGLVNALAAYNCATHGMIIRELTGWLWTEEEATILIAANRENTHCE